MPAVAERRCPTAAGCHLLPLASAPQARRLPARDASCCFESCWLSMSVLHPPPALAQARRLAARDLPEAGGPEPHGGTQDQQLAGPGAACWACWACWGLLGGCCAGAAAGAARRRLHLLGLGAGAGACCGACQAAASPAGLRHRLLGCCVTCQAAESPARLPRPRPPARAAVHSPTRAPCAPAGAAVQAHGQEAHHR